MRVSIEDEKDTYTSAPYQPLASYYDNLPEKNNNGGKETFSFFLSFSHFPHHMNKRFNATRSSVIFSCVVSPRARSARPPSSLYPQPSGRDGLSLTATVTALAVEMCSTREGRLQPFVYL